MTLIVPGPAAASSRSAGRDATTPCAAALAPKRIHATIPIRSTDVPLWYGSAAAAATLDRASFRSIAEMPIASGSRTKRASSPRRRTATTPRPKIRTRSPIT
jgi:hypothetical protein